MTPVSARRCPRLKRSAPLSPGSCRNVTAQPSATLRARRSPQESSRIGNPLSHPPPKVTAVGQAQAITGAGAVDLSNADGWVLHADNAEVPDRRVAASVVAAVEGF